MTKGLLKKTKEEYEYKTAVTKNQEEAVTKILIKYKKK